MLKVADFYDDGEILRKMRRANMQAAYAMEEDDEEDEVPRGTQRNRPEELDEESGDDQVRQQNISRIKRERQSRAPSTAPRRRQPDPDEMDED